MSEDRNVVEVQNGSSAAAPSRRRVWIVAIVLVALAAAAVVVVRLRAAGEEDAGAGAHGPAEAGPTPVRVAEAAVRDVTLTARYPGELDADAAEIAARTGGLLEDVRVRIGDRVSEGDVLARVDTAQAQQQVREAQAQVQAANAAERRVRATLRSAETELERTSPLLEQQLVSPQEIDTLRSRVDSLTAEAETASAQKQEAEARIGLLQTQIRDARLVAPFDGAIAERYLDPGEVVQAGTKVLRIVRSGALRVRFRVPERDIGRVEPGMPFEVTTQATGDRTFAGRVTAVAAEVSRDDRTVAVEGVLDEEAEDLRPGMYAQVQVSLGELADAVTVPGAALVERLSGEGVVHQGVYVVRSGAASFVPVEVRGRAGEVAAVSGIESGAQVVTLGHDGLRDGAPVTVSERAESP